MGRPGERVERAALIEWICVRASHRRLKAVDPSTPLNLHDDGRWSFCRPGSRRKRTICGTRPEE
jgi:hypothetical protein